MQLFRITESLKFESTGVDSSRLAQVKLSQLKKKDSVDWVATSQSFRHVYNLEIHNSSTEFLRILNSKSVKLIRILNQSKFDRFKFRIRWEPEHCNGHPWIFFPKIPEIDLRRFSLQFSLGVIVAIHEKLEKFQNISIEDLSENLQYLEKRFQCDNAAYKNKCRNNEAFSRYASYHWVFCLRRDICNISNGYPWVSHF